MKKILLALALCLPIIFSCDKKSPEEETPTNVMEDPSLEGILAKELQKSGISIKRDDIKFCRNASIYSKRISASMQEGFLQVSAVQDGVPTVYVFSYETEYAVDEYGFRNGSTRVSYKYIKSYPFTAPLQKEIIKDEGYGKQTTYTYSYSRFGNYIENGDTRFAIVVDIYEGERDNYTDNLTNNPRLIIDKNGAIKTVDHTVVDDNSGNYYFDYSLLKGFGESVICGRYCYSYSGEKLFDVSTDSFIYRNDVGSGDYVLKAPYGSWYFPINQTQMLIVYFVSGGGTKGYPCVGEVRIVLDDLQTGEHVFRNIKNIDDASNIYDYARFISEKDGIYTFEIDAILFSGDKKTFTIKVNRSDGGIVIS